MGTHAEEALYLAKQLRALRRWMAVARAFRWGARGGIVGCAAGLAVLVASRLAPAWDAPLEMPFALLLAGLAAGAAWGIAKPPSLQHAARWADERLALHDLLATAVELGGEAGEVSRALVLDAAVALQNSPISQAYPPLLTRTLAAALAGAGLMVALSLLPDLDCIRSPARRAEAAAARREGAELERRAAAIERRAHAWRLPVEQQIAANMKALGRDMRNGRIGRPEALAQLSRLTEQLRRHQDLAARGTVGRAVAQTRLNGIPPQGALARPNADAGAAPTLGISASRLAALLAKNDSARAVDSPKQLAADASRGLLRPEGERSLARDLGRLAMALGRQQQQELAGDLVQAARWLRVGDGRNAADWVSQAAKAAARQEILASVQAAAGGWKAALGGVPPGPMTVGAAQNAEARRVGGGIAGGAPRGSTDEETPSGGGLGNHAGASVQCGTSSLRKWTRLYCPRRVRSAIGGAPPSGLPASMRTSAATEEHGAPEKGTPSAVPYYQVYPSYAREAERAINSEEVPPAYRRQVKAYFDALKP